MKNIALLGLILSITPACGDTDKEDEDSGWSADADGGTEGGEETGGEETGGEETGGEETGATGGESGGESAGEPAEWLGTLTGTIQYKSEEVDASTGALTTACDFETAITSRPFVGDCEDCDFAFKIDSVITADESTSDCEPYAWFSLTEDWGPGLEWVLGFSSEWEPEGDGRIIRNVLQTGTSFDMWSWYSGEEPYSYGYTDGGVSPGEPEAGKSDEDEEPFIVDGEYEDYYVPYDYMYGRPYTDWEVIAFDMAGLPEDLDIEDFLGPRGTATFDTATGILNWTSTHSTFDYDDLYFDPTCSWYDDFPVPVDDTEDIDVPSDETTDPDEDDGDDPTDADDGPPAVVAGPATMHTATGTLSCSLSGWEEEGVILDIDVDDDEDEDEDEDEAHSSSDDGDATSDDVGLEDRWSVDNKDIWTVNLTAGVSTLVTIDTLSVDTSVDTWFYLSDPDECVVSEGYNDFTCTATDLGDRICPGNEFIPDTSGTHYLIIDGHECAGETATYQIGVDGPDDPSLTLLLDETSGYAATETRHTVTGQATVVDYGPPETDTDSVDEAVTTTPGGE